MSWWGAFVGIPFREGGRDREALDCWGLVRLVFAERFAVLLPDYADITSQDTRRVARAMAGACDAGPWRSVTEPQAGDVLMMTAAPGARLPLHVGVMTDAAHVLHTFPGQNSCVLPIRHHMIAPLVLGWQRHAKARA